MAAVLLAPALAGCLTSPLAGTGPDDGQGAPDLVLHGGTVWTGDAANTRAEALAVRGQRVLAVGTDAEILALAGPATRRVDLGGATVLPGLHDQHAHLLEVAAETPRGSDAYRPTHAEGDAVGTELGRQRVGSYHLATKAAGKTPSHDWQADPVTDCRPPSAVTEELKGRLRYAQEEAAAQGLTTVVEAGLVDLGILDALIEMAADGELRLRVLVRIAFGCLDEAVARGITQGWGDEWVRVVGLKLYADGWLGPRTSALREPYADRPLSTGVLFQDAAQWQADVRRARALGFHVATHTIGDRAMEVMLDAYGAAGVGQEDRWSLEHVQVLAPDLLDRMAAMGVVGSMQTSFATTDMTYAEDALGPERARWAYAWQTALERGVPLAGGSDFPIEVLHPLWGLQRVATRQEVTGQPAGGWHPEERLTPEQALRLVTSGAAFANLEEGERGSLEAGRYADLVVVEAVGGEPLPDAPPASWAAATVRLTMVNGAVTFEGAQAHPPPATGAAGRGGGAAPYPERGSLAASAAAAPALAASATTNGATPISTA